LVVTDPRFPGVFRQPGAPEIACTHGLANTGAGNVFNLLSMLDGPAAGRDTAGARLTVPFDVLNVDGGNTLPANAPLNVGLLHVSTYLFDLDDMTVK